MTEHATAVDTLQNLSVNCKPIFTLTVIKLFAFDIYQLFKIWMQITN